MRATTAILSVVLLTQHGCEGSGSVRGPSSERAATPSGADAGYLLELGRLHERHGSLDLAVADFRQVLASTSSASETRDARQGLSRVLEAEGDLDGAISALEPVAREDAQERGAGVPRAPAALAAPETGSAVERLVSLYARVGRFDDAEVILERGLAVATDQVRRDHLLAAVLAVWRLAGTADARIRDRESVLADSHPDEATLHLLAIAYGGSGARVGLVTPSWALGGPDGPALEKLTRVYERLVELHPRDPDLRQALISLYERGRRVDEAIALVRTSAAFPRIGASPVESASACALAGIPPQPDPPELAAEAEVVRILVRAGRDEEARAETRRLIARGRARSDGVGPYRIGARLYLEQGEPGLAIGTLATGAKESHRLPDRRALAVALADLLADTGRKVELGSMLSRWKASGDVCLREEGRRREAILAEVRRDAAAVPARTSP